MGLLSVLGKRIKEVVTFDISKFADEPVQRGALPIGAGAVGLGRGLLSLVKGLPSVGKAIRGFLTATVLGGAIAGGGLKLIPKIFKGAERGTEILLRDEPIKEKEISDVAKVAALGGIAGLVGAGITLLPDILRDKEIPSIAELPAPLNAIPTAPIEKERVSEKPVVAETEIIEPGVVKKRPRRRIQPRRQTISQRVDVRVGVNAGNRRNIKNVIFT